ncbi:MAG: hypothetical protein D6692_00430 [Planctomycetota bacterium]|nr:MAG: hypothetical protein D6692_00430 [Planctomycetota bacterium]
MTLRELKNTLAGMWGYEDASLLPDQDQADLTQWINEALAECYSPVGPARKRGEWAERYFSVLLPGPLSVTLGLTQGSTAITVTGGTLDPRYAGSFVTIGDRVFRYAGKDESLNDHLLQPWPDETGSYAAVVYHSAVELPADVVDVAEQPTVVSVGPLYPVPGAAGEILLRTSASTDFIAEGRGYLRSMLRRRFSDDLTIDTGDPYYYHVDSASIRPTITPRRRLHVYPAPDRKVVIEGRAAIMPPRLSNDNDVPALPGDGLVFDMASSVLLPIAREILVLNSKGRRFEGDAKLIAMAAERARSRLKDMARPQRARGLRVVPRPGW